MKHIPRICAIAMVIGFFLPFLPEFSGINLVESSFLLGQTPHEALDMFERFSTMSDSRIINLKDQTGIFSILLLSTALIPIVSLAAIILDSKFAHIVSGLVPIALLSAWSIQLGKPLFDSISIAFRRQSQDATFR